MQLTIWLGCVQMQRAATAVNAHLKTVSLVSHSPEHTSEHANESTAKKGADYLTLIGVGACALE